MSVPVKNTDEKRYNSNNLVENGAQALPQALLRSPLFEGIKSDDIDKILPCLDASKRTYWKQESLLMAGDAVEFIGIVLKGTVRILREDMFGNRMILSDAEQYDMFGEAFACTYPNSIPYSVIAVEDTTVMWLRFRRITTPCSSACEFHSTLIENMMKILAGKNIILNRKIEHLSKKSIRSKIMAFLIDQAESTKGLTFNIPFSRSELADYLCVDRSALSRELGRMRDEGLIDMHRNSFKILSRDSFII